jgi:uncharacterized pyridoxal phosphate-containing UPF0001 family protein
MNIARNLEELRRAVPNHVKIIAVSKTKPVSLLKAAYDVGQKAFGENYVQEIVEKNTELPSDIEWHFIGHLQTNKVKYIAPYVHLIHSVDSLKLLAEINKQAVKCQRIISVFEHLLDAYSTEINQKVFEK